MHIIFGSKDPSKKASVRLRKKGDLYYSASNYNLIVKDDAELTLGEFIGALELGGPFWESAKSDGAIPPPYVLDEELALCRACRESAKVPCALFQNPKAERPPDASTCELVKALLWRPPGRKEARHSCNVVRALRDMTETPAEARFYDLYIWEAMHRSVVFENAPKVLERAYSGELTAEIDESWGGGELGSLSWLSWAHEELMHQLRRPALVPQVVLNFVLTSDLPEDHPDKHFFDSDVGRVDFFFLDSRGKHIIEIDGPYHHSSEEEYTRVLRRDRTLRRQGYWVHRFSNMEVMQAKDFHAFAWELFY